MKILKYKNIENVTRSQVRKFKENFDFDKNEENLLKLYRERFPKNVTGSFRAKTYKYASKNSRCSLK